MLCSHSPSVFSVFIQIYCEGKSLVLQTKRCKYSENVKTNKQTKKPPTSCEFSLLCIAPFSLQVRRNWVLIWYILLSWWLRMVFQMRWIEKQWTNTFVKCSLSVDSCLETKLVLNCCTHILLSNNWVVSLIWKLLKKHSTQWITSLSISYN